ncbi:hypothetical protein D3C81_1735340 [compost metagenome]
MPLEHEVATAIAGLLDGEHVHRPLHHAQQCVVAARIAALRAQLVLAERAAAPAVTDPFHRPRQRMRQTQRTATITLEHLQRHALGSLLSDAGQDTQGVDQLANQGAEAHGEIPMTQTERERRFPAAEEPARRSRFICDQLHRE